MKPLINTRLWITPTAMAFFLIVIAQHNFLAFHTLAELFAIVISFVMFAVAWSTRRFSTNSFLLFLACGYLWIGSLDLMHTLVYKGINVVVEGSGNLSVQFWIATRFSEALLLFAAPFASSKKQNGSLLVVAFGVVAIGLMALVLTGNFPTGFVDGKGLTDFKIYSEYLIILILALAIIALFRQGSSISNTEKSLIVASIVMTMCAELAFTFYISVYGLSNLAGHIFKLFSFWFIFQAIIIHNLNKPYYELQESEKDLNNALADAEGANEAKSEFLASMSHELRTPLNAVIGFAQMLQFDPKHPLSPDQNSHVENILDGGNHLLKLVNDILDLTVIEAHQISLTLREVHLNETVNDCVTLTKHLANKQEIKIENKFDCGPTIHLRTDQARFNQVMLNLLSNAFKFNRDKGEVIIDGHEVENGYFRILVSDSGVGIPKKDHETIFDVFNRRDVNSTVAQEGTGIGLTITKQLVERMSGRIGLESEVGSGSTFWIELPLASNKNVFIWTDTLRTGVDAIDKDHQILISLLNKVTHGNMEKGEIDKVIDSLIDYTLFHFRREEKIMEICDYPDLESHREIHRSLVEKVNDIAADWRKTNNPELLQRLQKLLRIWLFDHIVAVDRKIAGYASGKETAIRKGLESLE